MEKMLEYVDIKDFCTLKVGGKFRYFIEVDNVEILKDIYEFAKEKNLSLFVIGGGSNIVFSDGVLNMVFIKMNIKGFDVLNDSNIYTDIRIGAGEIWDKVVEKTVQLGISGFELLSGIPGTVGATPVQNVGAYGSEVKDTIQSIEVFEIKTGIIKTISCIDCKFGYRDSIFKNEARGRYVIVSVIYRLNKYTHYIPKYPGVIKYFEDRKIINPSLFEIREAILNIRKEKLPNPKEIPNVGSFFKNPIVDINIGIEIQKKYSNFNFFKVDDSHIKIPAGWLIENAGLKGKSFNNVSIYNKNALVLINSNNATSKEIIEARDQIIKIVNEKFGIMLEQEPEMV